MPAISNTHKSLIVTKNKQTISILVSVNDKSANCPTRLTTKAAQRLMTCLVSGALLSNEQHQQQPVLVASLDDTSKEKANTSQEKSNTTQDKSKEEDL